MSYLVVTTKTLVEGSLEDYAKADAVQIAVLDLLVDHEHALSSSSVIDEMSDEDHKTFKRIVLARRS